MVVFLLKTIGYEILKEPKIPFKIQGWFILTLMFKNGPKKGFIKTVLYPDTRAYPGKKIVRYSC